jgi:hypothetical protein
MVSPRGHDDCREFSFYILARKHVLPTLYALNGAIAANFAAVQQSHGPRYIVQIFCAVWDV